MNFDDFKPMLACDHKPELLKFPYYASPKLDGVRAIVMNGKVYSRSKKLIPNQHVQFLYGRSELNGLDGELIVGEPNKPDTYRNTVSGVMSEDKTPDVSFNVFDHVGQSTNTWAIRFAHAKSAVLRRPVIGLETLPHVEISSAEQLDSYEAHCLNLGYEGVMLRSPDGHYKFGRATAREGTLLKVKRFNDGEAEVLEVIEEMHNGNEAQTNELGRTKRSSHIVNKTAKGRMGALRVRDLTSNVEFRIGTGFDDSDKEWWWLKGRPGLLVKYKSLLIGVKDKPRHPVYLGLRDARDMS
jgi:DNA ligase 1